MRKNKVGSIFLISVLTLAGLGVSYAGFYDIITVYGTVNTATVEIELEDWYSGTWVWKVWGPDYDGPEIYTWRGWVQDRPTKDEVLTETGAQEAELVSWAYAGAAADYDVKMEYSNLFPCIDFSADFIFHYNGSIPAKVNIAQIFTAGATDMYPGTDIDFLTWLWNYNADHPGYGAWVQAYRCYKVVGPDGVVSWAFNEDQPVDIGYQLHKCMYVYVKLIIHLPQDNLLQGLTGQFGGRIGVIQWTDPCPPDVNGNS